MTRVATFAKFTIALVAMVLTASCGGGSGDTTPATQLTVSQTALAVTIGESRSVTVTSASASALRATAKPSEICSTTIDSNTLTVTGVSGGKCDVLVSDGNGNIIVTAEVGKMEQPLKVVPKSREIEVGHTGSITFDTPSAGLTTATVSDSNVCSVIVTDHTATLTGIKAGECKVTASNGGDNVYAETSIDVTFTVTATAKADQTPLIIKTFGKTEGIYAYRNDIVISGTISLQSDVSYNSYFTATISGGSGSGELTVTATAPSVCSATFSNNLLTVSGISPGDCEVIVEKNEDTIYKSTVKTVPINVYRYRDKLAAAAAAYNANKSVYHPSGLDNPATSIAGSDVVFYPTTGTVDTSPTDKCRLVMGMDGIEIHGFYLVPYSKHPVTGTPEYGEAPQGSCDAATSYFRDKMLLMNL